MKKNLLIIMLAFTAQIKSQCFEIQSILVDACDGGNEGRNEMVIFQVGSSALNTSNLTVAWPNNSWLGITQNAGTAADIATVNATIIGCGLLKEPVAGVLPANSKVLLITSTAWNPLAQSFVNLSDTLIVIFQTAGNTAGHFVNYGTATPLTRTLNMSFSTPIGCSDAVTYDRSQLLNQSLVPGAQDGGAVEFTPSGTATYVNHGCQAPYIPLSVDAGVNKIICINSTLSLTALPTGNYNSVNWSIGAGATGSFSPTNSLTTVYTPGAGDNNSIKLYCTVIRSCVGHTLTAKDSINITVNQIPLPAITTPSTTICSGQSSVLSYSLSNASSTGTTSVQWLPSNLTTSTISVNTAGTYSVVVSNACGNNTSVFTLSVTPIPTVGITASGLTQFCSGGSVTYTANSNANNYSWTGGITTQTILINTTNTIVVTSTNSCGTATATQATSVIALPVANAGLTSTLTCSTTTVALAGSGGGTYAWSGPSIISGSNTATPTINASGVYSLIVTSLAGCSSSVSTVSISQNITPPSPTATNTITLTCSTTTAALTGGGGGTYSWSGSGITAGGATSTPTVNAPGTYTLLVTAANGCTATANTTLSQNITPPSPTATNATTLSCTTTTAVLTGGGGGTYSWSGPGITAGGATSTPTVNAPGTYTLLVTAANGCTATANTTLSQNITPPSPTATNATTLTCSTTTAVLTGGGGGTYSWSGPGITAGGATSTPTVNAPGTYTLLVTAANGCTATANTTLSQNITLPSPTATNATTLTCSTTTAVLTGGGGGTYSWSGPGITAGGATSTPTVNAPGTYTLLVTAVNGCTATVNTTLSQNITPPSPTATNATTLTCSTTTAVLTGGGGGTYAWSGPSITAGGATSTPTVNAPGTYIVLVTAANGCTATANTAITQNTVIPSVTMPGTQTITCASPTVSLIGSAGPSTCTALWSGGVCSGSTSFTASACSPNTYTLTVTNPTNGCINSGTVSVIPSVGIPVVNSSNTGSITCTNLTSQVSASTTMTPVSYAWTGPGAIAGAATTTGTVSLGGTYQCVVTNTLTGCASTITTFVPTNTTAVVASVAPTASITCSTTSLALSASPTGSYSYSWSPSPSLTGNSVSTPTVTLGGTYSVVITNTINGCVGNTNVTVPSNTTIPVVTIAAPSVTTTCANPTITISAASTPSSGVTYSWTAPGTGSLNNSSLSNPIASGSGIFTIVVTNTASGCSSSLTQNTVQITPDLAIPVTTLSSNAASITCSNPTPSVSITTTTSPVSYSWSPSSGIVAGTETTSTPSFSMAGSYSVVVKNTTSGCATNITSNVVTVTLDNTIPTITITPSQTLTCTTPTAGISTTVSPSSNIVYTWSGSGVSGSTTSSVIVNQAGIYSTTVTNSVNGCSVTANASITSNTAVPTVTVSPNSFTTTCASPTVQLTASTSTSSVTYTWTSPGTGSLDNYSIGNPIASGSGIFTVSVTDASNGCSTALSQATVQVIADAGIPVINFSSSTETITCSNPTPSVAITTTASPVSYSWSPTIGIVAGTETTATPSFSLAGNYSVVVTNTVSGCATSINIVTISLNNTPPVITLSSGTNTGTITCTNPSVSISPSVTPSTNLTYSWSADSGISTPLNQAAATFTAAGIYTLAVTNTLTGCVSSTATPSTYTVLSNTNTPTVSVVPTSSNTVIGCGVNSSVTYTANATTANGSATYSWNPGAVTSASFSASSAGVYTSVVTDAVSGCSTTTQFTVAGNSIVPNLSSSANASFPCGAKSTTLSASSTNTNVSFSWSGPSTAIITGSSTNTPTVDLAGNYVVTVIDLTTGCINSNTISVTQTSITATFTSDPSSGISPLTVNFTNQTTGATTYSWNFGNGSVSTSTNPTSVFTTGSYTVTLIASAGSCSATAIGIIVVEDGLTLVIPNVFTPNGDSINDVFSITSSGVKEISLQIFNRWGQKLYEFSGPKASWDGIEPNGAKATDGTYFFFVKVTGFDEKVIEKNGTVNLFR